MCFGPFEKLKYYSDTPPPLSLEKFSGSAHAVGLRRHIQPPLHLE